MERFFESPLPTFMSRIINEYSHLSTLERGYIPIDIEELKECVNILLETIEKGDPHQFKDLVASVNKD